MIGRYILSIVFCCVLSCTEVYAYGSEDKRSILIDTNFVLECAKMAESFFLKDNDSVFYYSQLGIGEGQRLDFNRGTSYNYLMAANFFGQSGAAPDSILQYIDKARTAIGDVSDLTYQKWLALSNGELFHQTGNFERSLHFYLSYIDQCKLSEDEKGNAFGHMRIAQALRHFGMFDESIKYHHLAWEFGKELMDSTFHRVNLDYLYFALDDKGLIDSSMIIKQIANSYATKNHQAGQYYQNADLAFQFKYKSNYDSSYFYFDRTLQIVLEQNNLSGIIETYGDIAMLEYSQDNFTRAETYWQEFDKYRDQNIYASLYYLPYRAASLKKQGAHESAYELLELHNSRQGQILTNDMAISVADQITKFENADKEEELRRINKELEQESVLRNYLLLGLLALVGLSLYLWTIITTRQRINKQRVQLAEQEVLIQKQKNIDLEREQAIVSMRAMNQGQESERNRIARDLHDGMGGFLSSLKFSLSKFVKLHSNEEVKSQVDLSTQIIDKASRELRRIAQDLAPESLSKFGLVVAIDDLISELDFNKQLDIKFIHHNLMAKYNSNFSLAIYRIIQELINNIIKHADATEAIIQLIQHQFVLNITVEDDGRGFELSEIRKGRGIENIRTRIAQYQGNLEVESDPMNGTSITISCAVPKKID